MADLRLAASGRPCPSKLGARRGHSFEPITKGDDDLVVGWICRRCGLTFFITRSDGREAP